MQYNVTSKTRHTDLGPLWCQCDGSDIKFPETEGLKSMCNWTELTNLKHYLVIENHWVQPDEPAKHPERQIPRTLSKQHV